MRGESKEGRQRRYQKDERATGRSALATAAVAELGLDVSLGALFQLREDLLGDGGGKATAAQEGKQLLPALARVGSPHQARPALRGLRPCRGQHGLGGEVLLDGLLDERTVDPTLA